MQTIAAPMQIHKECLCSDLAETHIFYFFNVIIGWQGEEHSYLTLPVASW